MSSHSIEDSLDGLQIFIRPYFKIKYIASQIYNLYRLDDILIYYINARSIFVLPVQFSFSYRQTEHKSIHTVYHTVHHTCTPYSLVPLWSYKSYLKSYKIPYCKISQISKVFSLSDVWKTVWNDNEALLLNVFGKQPRLWGLLHCLTIIVFDQHHINLFNNHYNYYILKKRSNCKSKMTNDD